MRAPHYCQPCQEGLSSSFSLSSFSSTEKAVDEGSCNAIGSQSIYLVLHQRDQWRDYDCQSRHQQGWQLIGEGLPAAGRHQNEYITSSQCVLYDLPLTRPEAIVPEILFESLFNVVQKSTVSSLLPVLMKTYVLETWLVYHTKIF